MIALATGSAFSQTSTTNAAGLTNGQYSEGTNPGGQRDHGGAQCASGAVGNDRAVGLLKSCTVAASDASSGPAPSPAPAPAPAAAPAPAPATAPAAASAPAAAPAAAPAPAYGGIFIDTTSLPVPAPGIDHPYLSEPGPLPPLPGPGDWETAGAFRLVCNWSHMGFDDPIAFPAQPGVAHHHTFFGNTAIDAYTNPDNIRSKGNASCRGGTINLSGYWVPSMIDTSTHKPIAPKSLLVYYKTGWWPYMNDNSVIQPLPKGLRMITGDASRATPGSGGSFECFDPTTQAVRPGTVGDSIPKGCLPGDEMHMVISFPECWDGVNLDSPDHKSHMATHELFWSGDPQRQYRCPLDHPVVLPLISFIVSFDVTAGTDTSTWRLASDTYDPTRPGGYSIHADWMNGWDPAISDSWGVKCLRERRNCGSAILGDGRIALEFQGN